MKKRLFHIFLLIYVFHFSCEALSLEDIDKIKNKIKEKDITAQFLDIKKLNYVLLPVHANNCTNIWKKYCSQSTQYLIVPTINEDITNIILNFPEIRIVLNVDQQNYINKEGELTLQANDIKYIKYLWVTNIDKSATCIADNFLDKSNNLESVIFDLPAIKEIKKKFLSHCSNLKSIDLSSLLNIEHIGNNFLSYCFKLAEATLPSLSSVTQIGDQFFTCSSLEHIDLSSLTNVTHIGDYFLSNCKNLVHVDLSSLEKLTHIGNYFLADDLMTVPLSKLTDIVFPSSMSITHIGDCFLYGCCSLKKVNLLFLTNVIHIGNHFLYNYDIFKEIDLSFLKNIKHIGNYFLANCKNLTHVTLSSLPKLKQIGNHFLSNCNTLKQVHLSFLPQLKKIGNNFVSNCKQIELIDLSSLPKLNKIENDAFLECYALRFNQIPKTLNSKVGTEEFSEFVTLNNMLHNALIVLSNYIKNGTNQKQTCSIFADHWDRMGTNRQKYISDNLMEKHRVEHPRMQEIIKLIATESNEENGPLFVYKKLIEKLKKNAIHNSKTIEINHAKTNQKMLFTFDSNIFSYRPLAQKPLAMSSEVFTILNNTIPKKIQSILTNPSFITQFEGYFSPPFTDTGIMLQAIIAKYATMRKDEGRKRLCDLIQDLDQCGPGKNQVILNTYTQEAIAEPLANIKHAQDLLNELNEYEDECIIINKKRIKKETLLNIVNSMLKKNNFFYNYMIDYTTKSALKLKKLISQIVLINSKNDRIEQFCYIMYTLSSNANILDKKIDDLCKIYDAYLPANKYGDSFNKDSIENLIEMIDAKTIKDRWGNTTTLENLKQELENFVQSQEFQHTLNNFSDNIGYQLRELMDGFIRNGWYLGFLNLYETSMQSNLAEAISTLYQHIRIDKDIPFDLNHLKDRILQEFDTMKIMGINMIACQLSGKQYNTIPHISNYLVGLLGGVLGMRPIAQLPCYDIHLNNLPTSKSLQEALDMFHRTITPDLFVNHFKSMLRENKLEIINPETGINFIWEVISIPAKNRLRSAGILENDINNHLFNIEGELKEDFIVLLFLKELGLLKEIDHCPSQDMILD